MCLKIHMDFIPTNFTMINKETIILCKNVAFITWLARFLMIFKNSVATAGYLILPWKLKGLKLFLRVCWNPSKK